MTSVRVAVRLRPLNKREKKLSSRVIIQMRENITTIYKPLTVVGDVLKDGGHSFSFDYCYDSSDRESPAYASQEKIFEDIGHDVLKAAFEGFNVCIFAYGQSGSGKSYTMMGHKEDQGLIPRVCEGLFSEPSRGKTDAAFVHTEISYLEIYNEHVLDLLKTRAPFTVGGRLRVREHPKDGPYVENLSKIAVNNYNELKDLIAIGDNNRTTARTDVNDVSSRSHAIFTIMVTQEFSDAGMPREVLSKINLVDLAGSEKVDSSKTTGSRLKEGANINKSLVTLGSVISALADMSVGVQSTKKKQLYIPYRNSVLTWLLKDSLGGNAMTTMIATISPVDLNYMETLTTLRYASRVKNILNTPTVNEDGNKKTNPLQAEVLQLQNQLKEATQALQEKWSTSVMAEKLHQTKEKVEIVSLRKEGSVVVVDCQLPHLIGIDEDTSITLYILREGTTKIGSNEALCDLNIVLPGSGILSQHCVIENRAGTVTLFPQHGASCSVSDSVVMDSCQLTQGAIIRFGKETIFKFNHPNKASQQRRKRKSRLLSSSTLSLTDFCRSTNNPSNRRQQSPCEMNADRRDDLNNPGISFTSIPTLKETTVIQGSHPVPHNTLELAGNALLHGVSTRDRRQQKRDLCHQSGPRPAFEMLQTEAHSEAKIASYQVEEVWSGDASLQQATLLSLGDGCDMEPRGNANEFQGVVTECNKGRPDSGGSSLGSMSHLQSSGQTSSVSVLPQSNTHSQVDRKNHSRTVASCSPEAVASVGQFFNGEMDEGGGLQGISKLCNTGTAPVQKSTLDSFYSRVSGLFHDARHLVWSAPSVLQQIVGVRLYPIRARWTSNIVSLVGKENVSSVVKGCQVFLLRGSFVFSLFKESSIVSMVKALPLTQHLMMATAQLKPEEAARIIQDYFTHSDLTRLPIMTLPKTQTNREGMRNEQTLLLDELWQNNRSMSRSSFNKDTFETDSKENPKLITEPINEVSNDNQDKVQPSEALGTFQIIQTLITYPDSLLNLQTLPLPVMIEVLQSIISAPVLTSPQKAALYWLNVATCSHPNPQPALLILTDTQLYTLTNDSGELLLFHQLPLLQLKEVQVGLCGHSLRLMGSTQESILGVYTYSQAHTKEMCRAILYVICPEVSWVTQCPLFNRNLMEICLTWDIFVPDLQLDAGLRISCQFQESLRNLVYLLHCNMNEDTVPLGRVRLLLYTSVAVNLGPSRQSENMAQFLLTDTHFGLVQENAIFSPSQPSSTVPPHHLQFHSLTLRQYSDVCCVLVHEKEASGSVRLDVIFANVRARGHPEVVMEAATPSAHALNSAPHAEVWKLTFSCSSEAACLINHLSNV